MEVGKLTVSHRDRFGKGANRRLRAEGLVPGICYGHGLDTPLPISISPKALKAALDPVKKTNTVIEVTVEGNGGNRSVTAMLKDHQIDPLRREVTHVDLIAIDTEKEVEVEVPLNIVGKPAGALNGGTIHLVRRVLPVICKPQDIPIGFSVDVTPLDIGDAFHVSDLTLPPGVKPDLSEKLTLVTCVAPEAEEAPAEVAAEGEAAAAAPAEGDKKAEPKKGEGEAKKEK